MDDTVLKLMGSYLNNRKQYISNNDSISETPPVCLFLIYKNDFSNSSETFKYIMYADDTILFTTIQSSNIYPKDVN